MQRGFTQTAYCSSILHALPLIPFIGSGEVYFLEVMPGSALTTQSIKLDLEGREEERCCKSTREALLTQQQAQKELLCPSMSAFLCNSNRADLYRHEQLRGSGACQNTPALSDS